MSRMVALLYGLVCYSLFGLVSIWAMAFLGNFLPSGSIDSPARITWPLALTINLGLLVLFALQHSIMARPWFKRSWTKVVPEPVERSTYVLFSCVALGVLIYCWQPMGGTVWQVQSPLLRTVLYALFFGGWLTIVATSFLINHFDLFGLRQVWLYYQGRPYTHLPFKTPGVYRWVRHPLYVGWLLTFWAAPTMTISHLVFALGTTAYILIAIVFEERDLLTYHGELYAKYRQRTPMLLPWFKSRPAKETKAFV
ncbi:methanethiol S-methyltransferase [Anatilimnocola sp. NA78]|uniref:methanethiol S-methyltransferase n=1 Tax=Anatilimnocola sp. NA78 TaxID=3415683 RepID=UPI003CE4D5F4